MVYVALHQVRCHSPVWYFCLYFPRCLILKALLDPWMTRVTFWKKVQGFISFRPCERRVTVMDFLGMIIPLGWRTILSWAGLCWAGESPAGIKLQSCTRTDWHVLLLPGSSHSSAVPKGAVIYLIIILQECKVCFYTLTVPQGTSLLKEMLKSHRFQPRNLSWEDDRSCTFSTGVHFKSRNVPKRLWQHCFTAVTKWYFTETDLIFCFEAKVLFEILVWFKEMSLLQYLICKDRDWILTFIKLYIWEISFVQGCLMATTSSVTPRGSDCFLCHCSWHRKMCVQHQWMFPDLDEIRIMLWCNETAPEKLSG